MNNIARVLFAMLLLSVISISVAGDIAYTCEVKHIYNITDNGVLETSTWDKEMKGSTFSVSRITGEIIGEVVPTFAAQSTRVLNKGSKDNSFKAIADFGEQFQVLEVQEFRSGSLKPFVALSMGGAGIVTGTCR